MTKLKLWSALLLLSLFACNQDEVQQSIGNKELSGIQFTSNIGGVALTRANGATWATNDSIGVYMKENGKDLSANSTIDGAANILYSTKNGNGNFTPVGSGIHFPEKESTVDFIAYYPQRALENPFVYPIDIANQNNIEAIDLLYSNNLTSISSRTNALNLAFTHQLSRLIFNVKSTDNTQLTNLKLKLSGVKTKAVFSLADATLTLDQNSIGTIDVKTTVSGTTATAQVILIPESPVDKITLSVELNGTKRNYTLPLTSLEKGQAYSYNLSLTGGGIVVDPSASYIKWMETPLITQSMLDNSDLLYVNHYMPNAMIDPVSRKKMRNYSMLYSKKDRIAYWVAYPLFPACTGSSGRTDAWGYDPDISSSYQGNLSSGFGGNGYDRGHQIPSGDRTSDKETNKTTFYYSNMTPQVGAGLNQSNWNALENQVREWRSGTDTVYVVTGAMPPASNVTYMKEMAVPAYYFKALARRSNGVFTTIAFKFENKSYPGSSFIEQAISVKELEDITGFTFFPTIDPSLKAILDKSKWQ